MHSDKGKWWLHALYSNVNKTCKSVYNVYTYQIHITQLIITYVPS